MGKRRMFKMNNGCEAGKTISGFIAGTALMATLVAGCAGGSLTTREKGAGIGALGGAAAGGIIGSAVRHPGAGAAIGGLLGLGAGALVGDQLQGRDNHAAEQDQAISRNQEEIERQRRELEELRRVREY
jgi:phage tail tape-measure protein